MTTEKEMEKVEREEYERTAGGESVDSDEEFAEESGQALMDSYRWQGVI
jgi:general stress protein YciG